MSHPITDLLAVVEADVAALRRAVDAQFPPAPPQGDTLYVSAGGSIQAAIDEAMTKPTVTTIRVEEDQDYAPFIWRKRTVDVPLRVCPKTDLPPGRIGDRHTPVTATLPRLARSTVGSYVGCDRGAHDCTLEGFEIANPPKDAIIVAFGTTLETSLSDLAHRMVFDRMYVHANPVTGGFRVFAMNCGPWTIRNSYVSDFWYVGRDNQAIAQWNGPGPGTVENNWLEASGENLLVGGSDCKIPGVAPSLAAVRGNVFYKPQTWKTIHGSVKNLFELKNCWGALIEENVFDGCWVDAQAGHGVVFTPRNQNGTRPDSQVRDVIFRKNVIRNVDGFAFNLLGWDDEKPSARSRNALIHDNLILTTRNGLQVSSGWDGLQVYHNTFLVNRMLMGLDAKKDANGQVLPDHRLTAFVFRDNLSSAANYGINGSGYAGGISSLTAYADPDYVVRRNGVQRVSNTMTWPADNVVLPSGVALSSLLDAEYRPLPGTLVDIAGTDGDRIGRR